VRASISAVEVDGLRCRTGATLDVDVEGSLDIDNEEVDNGSRKAVISGVTGVEPAFIEDSTAGVVDKLKLDSIDDRLAEGGEVSSLLTVEEDDAIVGEVIVY
jgi:hypothetical protein